MKNSEDNPSEKQYDSRTNAGVTKFANWVVKRRWFIVIGAAMLAMTAGSGMQYLSFNNDYHIFFDAQNPTLLAFDALQEKYSKDDNVFIVIEPESGEVFSRETLSAIEDLEKMSWQTPFSTRVDALSNYQHTHSEGDDMYVENLASDVALKTNADIERIKNIALNEPLLVDRLINKEGTVTAVNITVNLPVDDMEGPMVVMAYVREMVAQWEEEHPGFNTYLSGFVMLNGAFAELSMKDMSTLVPIMFILILITVFISTRSFSGMVTAFFVLLFSIMTAMGLAGWVGIQLTGPSSAAPTMIMTLAIADSIHILVTMLQLMRRGVEKREAIKESIRINFMPVFITSVTTIIGFLTLNFIEGPPFHDLGNITATGVAAAFLFSIFLLPALMAILPSQVKEVTENKGRILFVDRLAEFVISYHRKILPLSVVAIIGISLFIFRNELNN